MMVEVGDKFERWTVRAISIKDGRRMATCLCVCGNSKTLETKYLTNRLKKGWPIAAALTVQPSSHNRNLFPAVDAAR